MVMVGMFRNCTTFVTVGNLKVRMKEVTSRCFLANLLRLPDENVHRKLPAI